MSSVKDKVAIKLYSFCFYWYPLANPFIIGRLWISAAAWRSGIGHTIICLGMVSMVIGCTSLQKNQGSAVAVKESADSPSSQENEKGHKLSRPYRIKGKKYHPMAISKGYREEGVASWYGSESGNRTATGDRFKINGLTAAHKTLPLPTRARVTNLENNRSIVVVVNDRGPFHPGRLIDLSYGAAKRLNMHRHGTSRVLVEALD
jgi:rare lipoprotein A